MAGILYGVSVGPGDPELLTFKAKRVLDECAVFAVPRVSSGRTLALDIIAPVVDLDSKEIVEIDFAMSRDALVLQQSHMEAAGIIANYLDRDLDVAMPNLGDVTVYSTFMYIAEILQDRYQVEIVPGVTSFCASAAELRMSLTTMGEPLHIVPGGVSDMDEVLGWDGSKVLMKSGKQLSEVLDAIKRHGLTTHAQLVQNCGLPDQRVVYDITADDIEPGYFTTVIVK